MRTKFFAFVAMCLFAVGSAFGQSRTVTGQVISGSDSEPLIGVAILVQGTSNGTATDLNGNFTLQNVPANATLVVSYMGFTTQEVKATPNMKIVLQEDTELLDEIVVVGYGTQKKSDLTGAVASVRSEDLKNRVTSDAAAALQGKAAGIQVIQNSGAPGKAAEIRVRGVSSNDGNIGPLLIVDGLQVDNIQYLDPEMIQSVEVLKDAASAAIYGAQAGNGVILITTKKGSKGDGKVFYNNKFSLNSLSRDLNTMNAAEYIEFEKACGYLNDAMLETANYQGEDVNWSKVLFEPTWSQSHTVGFQGGNDKGSFFASLNYVRNNGIFVGDKDVYNRLTLQLNADYQIKKWLKVGTNNSIEKWDSKSLTEANDNGSALLAAINSSPLFEPSTTYDKLPAAMLAKEAEGYTLIQNPYNPGQYWVGPGIGNPQSGHPLVHRDNTDATNGGISLRGTTYASLMPFKGFVFTSRFGYRISQSSSHSYQAPYYLTSTIYGNSYNMSAAANTGYYYQWENFANYDNTFGKHGVTAMAGMSFIENNWDNVSVTASGSDILKGYADNFRYIEYLLPTGVTKEVHNLPGRSASLSYFARLGYSYDNRYAVQANFRADAFDTSKLPADKRWGYFPSVSAGWTLSNESFIKDNIDREILSFAKLRASYGINGNVNVLNNYPYSSSILSNVTFYQYNPDSATPSLGSLPMGLANPDLTWETSRQFDLGLDLRFFSDRLTVGMDYFNKNTEDLLVGISPVKELGLIVGDLGTSSTTTVNAGTVNNKGFELELGWKDHVGDFSYNVAANASWLSNKVSYLEPTVGRITGKVPQGTNCGTYFEEGHSVWYLLGYKALRVESSGENAGRVVYQAADGSETYTPTDADRVDLGSGIPKFQYGITVNLAWKNFDFTLFGTGVAGNKIFPTSWRSDRKECNTYDYYWDNSWKQEGDIAAFPAAQYWDVVPFSSSLSVFNGDYFKIKQIQLGYTLPQSITKKALINRLRIFADLDNFFTFTSYPGLDPETATTAGNAAGIDMGNYPTAKSFVFGVNIEF